jgi:hypothetical protein
MCFHGLWLVPAQNAGRYLLADCQLVDRFLRNLAALYRGTPDEAARRLLFKFEAIRYFFKCTYVTNV